MEPLTLTAGAIALGTVITTKALEKTGEKVGESLWNKTSQFLVTLNKHSPHTVLAIEKSPSQPLDFGQAVLEVESAAQSHPEVNRALQELVSAAKAEPNPKFNEILAMPNLQKLADKIGQFVMPGGTGTIGTQSF